MAQVRTKYIVYNHTGSGVRHHHFSSANNIIDETNDNYPGSTDNIPGTHTCYAFQNSPDNNQYPFAFMSTKGNVGNDHLFTTAVNQLIQVGSGDVDVLIVYAPKGGIGVDNGPGVWVDAFNLDTGDFSDDLQFITVLTPPTPPDNIDAAKTTIANAVGEIATQDAEHFRASQIIDGTAEFIEWKQIIGNPTISSTKDIELKKEETGEIWFAFYQSNIQVELPQRIYESVWLYLSPGVYIGGDGWGIDPSGRRVPIHGPGDPLTTKLLTSRAIISLSQNMNKSDRQLAIKLAVSNLDSIKETILKEEMR